MREREHYCSSDFKSFDRSSDFAVFIRTHEGLAIARQPVLPFWRNKVRPSEVVREVVGLIGCLHGGDSGQPYLSASSSSEGAAVLTLLFMTAIAQPDDSHIAHLINEGGLA